MDHPQKKIKLKFSKKSDLNLNKNGPGRIRTDDHPVMSRVLHQAKLLARRIHPLMRGNRSNQGYYFNHTVLTNQVSKISSMKVTSILRSYSFLVSWDLTIKPAGPNTSPASVNSIDTKNSL